MSKKNFKEIFHEAIGVDEEYKVPDRLMEIMLNKEERENLFKYMLNNWDRNLDYDWFHEYFQDLQAERKSKKQDFTPMELGELLNKIVNVDAEENGVIYEPTCGTGGIVINSWNEQRYRDGFFKYNPRNYIFHLEELSDRTIPFLLFNLSIRGMNASVFHGDVLSRKGYGVFWIENVKDDLIAFSNINVLPYSKGVEKHFAIEFVEERYPKYVENTYKHMLYRMEQEGLGFIE